MTPIFQAYRGIPLLFLHVRLGLIRRDTYYTDCSVALWEDAKTAIFD